MTGVKAVFRKEMKSYFNSPVAYIVALFFVAFTTVWFFFVARFFAQNTASLRAFFQVMPTAFSIIVPAVTMRAWAEEAKTGTAELLVTMPVPEWSVVAGKFLAAFALILCMLGLTLAVPVSVSAFGRFDAGQIVAEYLGAALMGAACVSIGTFVSFNSRNQISAFIFTTAILAALTLAGQVTAMLNPPRWLAAAISWISINFHFESFAKGLVDTRDVMYFVSVSALFLYLSARSLLARKWR